MISNIMEAKNAIIVTAADEVGYKAGSDKKNKYAEYFDTNFPEFYNGKKNGYDWCEIFCDWVYCRTFGNEIGRKMIYQPLKSAGAGVNASSGYYKDAGAWSKIPQLGCQIYFQNDGGLYHTGIVVGIKDGMVNTIEGNTGNTYGGEVMRHSYPQGASYIAGYGIPDYSQAVGTGMTVQDITDHIAELTIDTLSGEYGNGSQRKKLLGEWYEPVQWVINYKYKEV